jgi:hypothetical protein
MRSSAVAPDACARQVPPIENSLSNTQTPPPFVDERLPDVLASLAQYIEAGELECGGSVPPRWTCFVRVAAEAITLVRSGRAPRRLTLETLASLAKHYFDADDPQTHFSCRRVIEAFANATKRTSEVAS